MLFCLVVKINAQITYAPPPPPGAIVHHAPLVGPHVHVPVAVAPVAHVTHVAPVAHVAGPHPAFVRILSQNFDLAPDGSYTFQ